MKNMGKRILALLLVFAMCIGMSVTALAATNIKIITTKPNTWIRNDVIIKKNGKIIPIDYKITVPSNGTVTFTLKSTGYIYAEACLYKKPVDASGLGEYGDDIAVLSLAGKPANSKSVTLKKGTYYLAGPAYLMFKYTFKPDATKISNLKNISSRKIYLKWAKKANVTGYQIQYSTSNKFASSKTKSVPVKGTANISKTVSNLTKGKIYYVRVRTYNTISSKNYYSKWSAVKKVKINK